MLKFVKTLLVSSLVEALLALAASAQVPVCQNQYYPTSQTLRGVHFIDPDQGWIVGTNLVITTVNGGQQWSQVSGLAGVLEDVEFLEDRVGLIVGHQGTMFRSGDGGVTWSSVDSGTTEDLMAVSWGDDGVAYAVGSGGIVLRSTDEGMTWTTVLVEGQTHTDVSAAGSGHAWVVGGGDRYLWATTDGGETWQIQDSGEDDSFPVGIFFLDEQHGWMVASCLTFRTTDGGENWARDSLALGYNNAVQFTDTTWGYAVGDIGGTWYSEDGGVSWQMITNSLNGDLLDAFFLNRCRGWVVGTDGTIGMITCQPGTSVPYLPNCRATTMATQRVLVRNLPDGQGIPLTEAMSTGGGTENATVEVFLEDVTGAPVVDYPAENVYLASQGGGLAPCDRGTVADGPSDAQGRMTISGTLKAGGYSDSGAGEMAVVVIGDEVLDGWEMDISFNSPDIDGDLKVDCHDLDLFNQDLSGGYSLRSDFNFDEELNSQDLVLATRDLGSNCLDLPDPEFSTAVSAATGWISLLNVPDGGGDDLSDCYAQGGDKVDGTVTVTLQDSEGDPVPGFPAEDLWLQPASGTLTTCSGRLQAEDPTDAGGATVFLGPYQAGGHSEGPVTVKMIIDGCEYALGELTLKFNSPDEDGDLDVDLTDESLFLADLPPTDYDYRSDFNFDGYVDPVLDYGIFNDHVLVDCNGSMTTTPLAVGRSLQGAFPNPFNPRTMIKLELSRAGTAGLKVFDSRGRLIKTLLHGGLLSAGVHEVVWDGTDAGGRLVPSGIYFCRLELEGEVLVGKLALLR